MTAESTAPTTADEERPSKRLRDSPLGSLIEGYQHAVVFQESMPSPFAMAKLFTEMDENHGGLVLVGVENDGTVIGVAPEMLDLTWLRFEKLCANLTDTQVEMGTILIGDKTVVFLVFNTLPRHLNPLSHFRHHIDRTCLV